MVLRSSKTAAEQRPFIMDSSIWPGNCVDAHQNTSGKPEREQAPTGAAAGVHDLRSTAPSAGTSKSSSFHWPDGREADARLRISVDIKSQGEFGCGWLARFRSGLDCCLVVSCFHNR